MWKCLLCVYRKKLAKRTKQGETESEREIETNNGSEEGLKSLNAIRIQTYTVYGTCMSVCLSVWFQN